MNNQELRRFIYDYPTKYKEGFIETEILDILKKLNIDLDKYHNKCGVNTCMSIDDNTIYYHIDVERTIRLVLENREMKNYEFD